MYIVWNIPNLRLKSYVFTYWWAQECFWKEMHVFVFGKNILKLHNMKSFCFLDVNAPVLIFKIVDHFSKTVI